MFWLVNAERLAGGQLDRGHQSPALIGDGTDELDAFLLELALCRLDVIAHQVQLAGRFVGRMRSDRGGRRREDQPAPSGIDMLELEHIAHERADGIRLLRVDQRVHSVDHDGRSFASKAAMSSVYALAIA